MQRGIEEWLQAAGIERLNGMQEAMLAAAPDRTDVVLLSPTGSGKTLAFLLPLLSWLSPGETGVQALIVAPSRELALQIEQVFRSLATGYRAVCCYGGHPVRTEKKSLEQPPAVLIGTPGRLVDHFSRGNVAAETIRICVLDEFDKSLELGFREEMKTLLELLPDVRRRVLTSATDAVEVPGFVGLRRPLRLDFLQKGGMPAALKVYAVYSPEKDKLHTLYKLLCTLGEGSSLVFCNLRESAERVSVFLQQAGVDNVCFHGGLEQPDRERALSRFRNGSASVLVSTDLASRGLDIPDVKRVIHYHLPVNEEAYIHRNGRTARMGAEGAAFLILNEADRLPDYLSFEPEVFGLPKTDVSFVPSPWKTLVIGRGRRDKLSKKDIAGFLYRKGGLEKDDLGLVEVRESYSFAAVRREKFAALLSRIGQEKIKNMRAKFGE